MLTPFPRPLTTSIAAFIAALTLTLSLTASASASKTMQIGISDEGVTQRTPALIPTVIPQWKQMGMDVARVMIVWSYVAPDPEDGVEPNGFNAADPNDPRYNWGPVDQTINQLRASGIEPVVAVTGPGPIWGSSDPTFEDQRYKPDPQQFAEFATAAAKRYGADVDRWLIWNEPNVNQWLQPQQSCVKGVCVPIAPDAVPRDRARDLPGDQGRRPGLDGDRRHARAARSDAGEHARQRAPADVHARVRLRRREAAAGAQEQVLQERLQGADGGRLRVPSARHAVRAQPALPEQGRGQPRRLRPAAAEDARRHPEVGPLPQRRQQDQEVRHLLHRVRLPDQPARPLPGRLDAPSSSTGSRRARTCPGASRA